MAIDRKSLYFLYAATFFIFINFNISHTITPLYIIDVGGTEFFSGLQSTLYFLTAVILRFYFGPLADSKGNKRTLYIGAIAFATAPLLFMLSEEIWYIIVVRMYQAIGLAAYFSSAISLASGLAPRDQLGRYIGFYRLITMGTLIIGPTFAMKVITAFNYEVYHILGIIIGAFAIFFVYFIKEPQVTDKAEAGIATAPPANMLTLLKERQLSPIYLSIFVLSIGYGLILTFVGIFVQRYAADINPGIFFTLFGAGSVVANLTVASLSDKKGRAIVAYPCMLIMGTGIALLFLLPVSHYVIYLGSVLAGFGYAGSMAVLITWIVDIITPARRTTALALQDSSIDIGIASGSLFYGIIIPILGLPLSFGLSGVVIAIFALWRVTEIFRRKKEPLTSID
ncbi:MAG: hypothetical protein APF84_06345 [Gracilibacter sp. BRH_c7a]|nr:MAG: hypothetical protein APF84_06345 [Gracilibacter sp. BRH_c7a]